MIEKKDDKPKIIKFLLQQISLGILLKDVMEVFSLQNIVWPWPSTCSLFFWGWCELSDSKGGSRVSFSLQELSYCLLPPSYKKGVELLVEIG